MKETKEQIRGPGLNIVSNHWSQEIINWTLCTCCRCHCHCPLLSLYYDAHHEKNHDRILHKAHIELNNQMQNSKGDKGKNQFFLDTQVSLAPTHVSW